MTTTEIPPLRIAQLAPLFESVPPRMYGGTERIVSWLSEELVRRGHHVTLFASGDSRTRARLVPVVDQAIRLRPSGLVDPVAMHVAAAELVRRLSADFDVIHSHIDSIAYPVLGRAAAPMVATLHGRLDIEGLALLYRVFADQPVVSISRAQRALRPEAGWFATVHHGLPLDQYPAGDGSGGYLLFLGRISPEKGPDAAIRAARRAGIPLCIAAKVDAVDRDYFADVVEPLLHGPGVEFLDEVDDEAKVALLRDARALLFPIAWPEPFGLVMIEAMACGTPVIALRAGSVPEVIAHGRTGFICADEEELVRAIDGAAEIDRAECRRWVEQRFSAARMAADYEDVYRRLIARSLDRDHVDPALAADDVDADVPGIAV